MPKILPNRSSKTLTAANLEAIKGAIQTIIENLGEPIVITDDDFNALARMGETLKTVCDAVLEVAIDDPSYLEDEQPLEEVQKDKTFHEQMDDVRKLVKKVTFILDREQGVCGAEYRNAIGNYEANVKAKVNKGSEKAQLVLDKLKRIDSGTKPTTPVSATAPNAAAK